MQITTMHVNSWYMCLCIVVQIILNDTQNTCIAVLYVDEVQLSSRLGLLILMDCLNAMHVEVPQNVHVDLKGHCFQKGKITIFQ